MSKIHDAIRKAAHERRGIEPVMRPGYSGFEQPSGAAGNAESLPMRFAAGRPLMVDLPVLEPDPETCLANRVMLHTVGNGPRNAGAVAAYRMLRTRILQRARSNSWRTIGITSPGMGEGKSVTALNLALSVAREQNNNVFLLDLDLRSPSICHYLGVTPPVQLLNFFFGKTSAEASLFSIGADNLTLAGSTLGTDHSSELLATGRVEELFAYVERVAPQPLILVDLPPVMSNDDALVIAPKVDAMLVVAAEGISRRDSTGKTLELLQDFKIAGLVLNRSRSLVTDYYGA
jgi:protein-tyrosine kinase